LVSTHKSALAGAARRAELEESLRVVGKAECRHGVYTYDDGSVWDSGSGNIIAPPGVDFKDTVAWKMRNMPTGPSAPDDNPKTAYGLAKPDMAVVPPAALLSLMGAMQVGAQKYGPHNWRKDKVSSSVYYAAAHRHLMAWFDGEDVAADSGVHHLGHVMACCAILLDAASIGMLNDNRPRPGAFARVCAEMTKKIGDTTVA
jgi:hypothetical protein